MPEDEEDADAFEMKTVLPVDDWATATVVAAEPMMPRALPTTPPFEVPPLSPLAAAPLPGSAGEAASPIIRLPMPQASHAPPAASPARELPPPRAPQPQGGWISPNAAARELEPMEEPLAEQPEDDVLSEEAAVGRLSSMSLMAAVTASGASSACGFAGCSERHSDRYGLQVRSARRRRGRLWLK